MARIKGYEAIEHVRANGGTLCKYTDPIEEAREGISVEEAEEIAAEDPSLIYVETRSCGRGMMSREEFHRALDEMPDIVVEVSNALESLRLAETVETTDDMVMNLRDARDALIAALRDVNKILREEP